MKSRLSARNIAFTDELFERKPACFDAVCADAVRRAITKYAQDQRGKPALAPAQIHRKYRDQESPDISSLAAPHGDRNSPAPFFPLK
jgi:hypothetical protein